MTYVAITVKPNCGRLAAVRHAFHDVGLPQPQLLERDSQWRVLCPAEKINVIEKALAGKGKVTITEW